VLKRITTTITIITTTCDDLTDAAPYARWTRSEMHNATELEMMLGGVGLGPDRAIPR
jgi:hypothetical protein